MAGTAVRDEVRPVIVYDGDCAFCRAQVARIRAWDRAGRFETVPRRTPGIDDRFPILREADFNAGMRVVIGTGEAYVGTDAVHAIMSRLPRWRLVAWLYHVPGVRGVARVLYAWIARNRARLR
jgi:predicted DCC family thiol-disulfide oxidoreductase YuxK